MKKIIFACLVSLFIFSFVASPNSFSQEQMKTTPSPLPSEISYNLPYPGILPNNALYPLKVFRDRLVEFFISDPLKKAEFYLLEGDKHLAAALILVEQSPSNYALAETTISKGENYMEKSLGQLEGIQAEQQSPKDFFETLSTSLKKHNEQIMILKKNAPADIKSKLDADSDRVRNLEKKVESIQSNLK